MTRDLSYYSKLGFDNLYSWREEDISQFLIWDLLTNEKFVDFQDNLSKDIKLFII